MNQTRRIVTLGDLAECLAQFPPNTTMRVTSNENGVCGIITSPVRHAESGATAAIETYGEALDLEQWVNAMVVDHVAAIMKRRDEIDPNIHIGSKDGREWWTECLGCSSCAPEEYHPQDDTGAPRGPHVD